MKLKILKMIIKMSRYKSKLNKILLTKKLNLERI